MLCYIKYLLLFISLSNVKLSNTSQCEGINAYKRINNSAAGKWHLTRGIKIGGTNESRNACGFFNTVRPCKCIGVKITTNQKPPKIMNYTLMNFGYNSKLRSLAMTEIRLNLISKNQSIYNAYVPLAKINFTIAIIGSDDFASWMSLIMCDDLRDRTGNVGKLMWVITRSPQPSQGVINNATNILKQYSNSSSSSLINIDQSNCPSIL